MKLNNNGFSLLELLAVIVLTTVILVPLMAGFSDAVEVNTISQERRGAITVADNAINSIGSIDFTQLRDLVDARMDTSNPYLELNSDSCDSVTGVFTGLSNQNICTYIFDTTFANYNYESTEFKMYLFNYNLTLNQYNNINTSAMEPEAISHIQSDTNITDSLGDTDVTTLLNVVVWIDYHDNPDHYVVISGVIVDE